MATVGIALGFKDDKANVLLSRARDSAVITSSVTSQQAGMVALKNEYWSVRVDGGPVWVTTNTNPVASAGDTWLISDGGAWEGKATEGDDIAVIDA